MLIPSFLPCPFCMEQGRSPFCIASCKSSCLKQPHSPWNNLVLPWNNLNTFETGNKKHFWNNCYLLYNAENNHSMLGMTHYDSLLFGIQIHL